ncbi:hypothetical protein U0070_027205 [Myodes glareolus]|uniref:Uncharacterized protein n=1 Tax=Myodes glareolus TaxID=447135 RepID=A0AAW0IAR3_MYOGA
MGGHGYQSLEEICLFSLPIKEPETIGFFLGASLKDEVLRSCQCRSRIRLNRGPGSRLLSLLRTAVIILVWMLKTQVLSLLLCHELLLMASEDDCYTSAGGFQTGQLCQGRL